MALAWWLSVRLVSRPTEVQIRGSPFSSKVVMNGPCLLFFVYTLLSQYEFLPWEIRVDFPKESQLQQSRATQSLLILKRLLGLFLFP